MYRLSSTLRQIFNLWKWAIQINWIELNWTQGFRYTEPPLLFLCFKMLLFIERVEQTSLLLNLLTFIWRMDREEHRGHEREQLRGPRFGSSISMTTIDQAARTWREDEWTSQKEVTSVLRSSAASQNRECWSNQSYPLWHYVHDMWSETALSCRRRSTTAGHMFQEWTTDNTQTQKNSNCYLSDINPTNTSVFFQDVIERFGSWLTKHRGGFNIVLLF